MDGPTKRSASPAAELLKKPKVYAAPGKVVSEADVGVTQYINEAYKTGPGFFGSIKQRYSDFQVNEITLDGTVVHLTDEGIDLGKTKKERKQERRSNERADLQDKTPEEIEAIKAEKAEKATAEEKQENGENQPKYELSEDHKARLLELLAPEELQEVEALFTNGGNMETKTTFDDKATRTQLHQLLRQAFQGKLETMTSPENTFKVALSKGTNSKRGQNVNHVDDSGVINYGLGPFKNYLHFTLYKENRETMEVASMISKFLRVPHKAVKYAGTKDRRGITCQRLSIHKGKVQRVTSLNKGLNGSTLGGFKYESKGLDLGDLQGNEFLIAIRDVKTETDNLEEVVDKAFNSLNEKGFINYYGLQRFGTFSISTHVLGIELLKDNWKNAVDLLLAEQDRVVAESVESRRIWAETRDASTAAKLMPRRCFAEQNVLSSLAKEKKVNDTGEEDYHKQAYFRAIMQIPRNLRLIYVHAYQSYVWNMVASKRIELFGLQVREGDLIMVEHKNAESQKVVSLDEDGEEFEEDVAGTLSDKVRALTKEDIDSGNFSIYDVVLPSPGYDVVYPTSPELMSVYEQVMAKDGLDPHNMGRRVQEFSLAGSYRPLMGKASQLSYKIVKHKDTQDPILRTDLEILRAKKENDTALDRIIDYSDSEEATQTGIVLQMRLGVSCYATMALREFMKADTSRFSANFDVKTNNK
ncbi:hypothetical protein FT663_01131 [Candidozyma haemuli var. vulneris]|uniref:TRUD domain-containing protein n=1 Tax=Candidozyma haemuli TaxID=45357 RepID=A0A2V1AWD2_9ASCO|nr:hypothetical protein CXQ85_004825 [[Candida] haemuloni]KAF3993718.1 hypothetical protein FT662_00431 [[Candida] haemuloni var. vulneris]KAF3994775.1 hypothetical protein FT663_01131 [[Candida] haemuloni var. vulneris]PVH22155.1 hypothetical protein CXQ85_004825 [[Candida] haemuloni]